VIPAPTAPWTPGADGQAEVAGAPVHRRRHPIGQGKSPPPVNGRPTSTTTDGEHCSTARVNPNTPLTPNDRHVVIGRQQRRDRLPGQRISITQQHPHHRLALGEHHDTGPLPLAALRTHHRHPPNIPHPPTPHPR